MLPSVESEKCKIYNGDALETLRTLPDCSVNCCVTSPPYFQLRDYQTEGQIGLEDTPAEFVGKLVEVFRELRRVLSDTGVFFLNLGDSYSGGGGASGHTEDTKNLGAKTSSYGAVKTGGKTYGLPAKNLIGIPWRVAFALQDDGWILRQDIIWNKPNPMPESVRDRCTKSHEYIFMFSKQQKYFYDVEAIKEKSISYEYDKRPHALKRGRMYDYNSKQKALGGGRQKVKVDKQRGHSRRHAGFNDRWDQMSKEEQCSSMRNKRSVWTVATKPFRGSHFAVFPPELIEPCILAGCPRDGTVLDPFAGSGTTGVVANSHGRNAVLIELNPDYVKMAEGRLRKVQFSLEM